MIFRRFIAVFFITLLQSDFSGISFSQQRMIDSIPQLVDKDTDGIKKFWHLFNAGESTLLYDQDTAMHFFMQAHAVSGSLSQQKDNADTVIILQAMALRKIGVVNYYKCNYNEAIKTLHESLKLFESVGNNFGISQCLSTLGNVHTGLNNFDQAKGYFEKALEIDEKAGNEAGRASCLTNIGNVYLYEGLYAESLDSKGLFIKASEKYYASLDIYRGMTGYGEDSELLSSVSDIYQNLAIIFKRTIEFEKAGEYYNKSLEIYIKINDMIGASTVLLNKSSMLFELKKFDKTIEYCLKSLEISEANGILYDQQMAYEIIAHSYNELGRPDRAFEYLLSFNAIKDSIFNIEKNKQITEMEARYENEKKQLEINVLTKDQKLKTETIARQEAENKTQRILLISAILGLLILFVLAFIIFRQYRFKKRAFSRLSIKNKEVLEQKEEIENQRDHIQLQNDEISQQHHVVSEKNEEITSSIQYAKRIQQAMLPSVETIKDSVLEYFLLNKPRDIVSGDFYWAAKKESILMFAVADCTGHGVPGAFMSMLGLSMLNEIVNKHDDSQAGTILDKLRRLIIVSLKQTTEPGTTKDGMDIALCILNTETGELQYSGANNSLYLILDKENGSKRTRELLDNQEITTVLHIFPDGELLEIKSDKMPVSIYRKMSPFINNRIRLTRGDSLYLFSDGFMDQFGGENGKKLKSSKFREYISEVREHSLEEQGRLLDEKFIAWKGSYEQLDDVCVMGIRF